MHRDEVLQRSGKGPTVPAWVFRALADWLVACVLVLAPLAAVLAYPQSARSAPFPVSAFFTYLAQLANPVLVLALAFYWYREITVRGILRQAQEDSEAARLRRASGDPAGAPRSHSPAKK